MAKYTQYILSDGGKILHKSWDLYKLISCYTAETNDAVITYNGVIVWVQNPDNYIKEA